MPKPKDQGLLLGQQRPKELTIIVNSLHTITMTFTDARMAEQEYQRYKTQGTYQGQWIKEIYLA